MPAIEDLYRRRRIVFVRTIGQITGDVDAAHDAVQDGFAQALRSHAQLKSLAALEGWVWKICLNKARTTRHQVTAVSLDHASSVTDEYAFGDTELADAVRGLPERRRLAVFLRYYAGLSYDEISDATGMRPGTVAATLTKARTELAKTLLPLEVPRP